MGAVEMCSMVDILYKQRLKAGGINPPAAP